MSSHRALDAPDLHCGPRDGGQRAWPQSHSGRFQSAAGPVAVERHSSQSVPSCRTALCSGRATRPAVVPELRHRSAPDRPPSVPVTTPGVLVSVVWMAGKASAGLQRCAGVPLHGLHLRWQVGARTQSLLLVESEGLRHFPGVQRSRRLQAGHPAALAGPVARFKCGAGALGTSQPRVAFGPKRTTTRCSGKAAQAYVCLDDQLPRPLVGSQIALKHRHISGGV